MHDGYTDVEIPNSLLKSGSGYIYAWVYVNDKESGYTIRSIDIRVQSRAKPGNWNPPTDAPEESTKYLEPSLGFLISGIATLIAAFGLIGFFMIRKPAKSRTGRKQIKTREEQL